MMFRGVLNGNYKNYSIDHPIGKKASETRIRIRLNAVYVPVSSLATIPLRLRMDEAPFGSHSLCAFF